MHKMQKIISITIMTFLLYGCFLKSNDKSFQAKIDFDISLSTNMRIMYIDMYVGKIKSITRNLNTEEQWIEFVLFEEYYEYLAKKDSKIEFFIDDNNIVQKIQINPEKENPLLIPEDSIFQAVIKKE